MKVFLSFLFALFVVCPGYASLDLNSVASSLSASGQKALKQDINVYVISGDSQKNFLEKQEPLIRSQLKDCNRCKLQNMTPYTAAGNFNEADLASSLKKIDGLGNGFIVLMWNKKMSPEMAEVQKVLIDLIGKGRLILGSTGTVIGDERTLPLSRTVLGQVPDLVIIGEMGERERLLSSAFFGPEMLTAIRPPKELEGQGFAPWLFATRLATKWDSKSAEDWLAHFKSTKAKSRRLWPGVSEFFGN